MNSQSAFEWQFGGWTGFSPVVGWITLLTIAAVGVALAVWLYRDTLQKLSFRQRAFFVLLRSCFFLSLLLCLAGPSRVEKTYDTGNDPRPLAVVVDRSGSMTTPDSSGLSRLTFALRTWKQSETAAIRSFSSLRYFSLSKSLAPAASLDEAFNQAGPNDGTALFGSMEDALKSAPKDGYGGLVCLTDGIDTTDAKSDALVSRALQSHTPLYFAVGENRADVQQSLSLRETVSPGQVLRKTEWNVTALIEAHSAQERDVPLALYQDDHPLAQTTLHLRRGANLLPWSVPVHSDEPTMIHLSWRLGEGAEQETIAAAVRVVATNQANVLYYQGTLDWGFRFICNALRQDPSFTITGLLNPDLNIAQVITSNPQSAPTALPNSADGLQGYQMIVLANTFASQMQPAQQKAVTDFVSKGGGLLFLISDTRMAQTFSGTALESILPVVFEQPSAPDQDDPAMSALQTKMQQSNGANVGDETNFAAQAEPKSGLLPLKSFAVPPASAQKEIAKLFGGSGGADLPKFTEYARVASLKGGAEVMAVHADDKMGSGQPRALLVTQRFGQGTVTVLLTDALWRWRLSLPSASHAPETFWQQLFLALAGPSGAMHFSEQPYFASLGQDSNFRVEGAPGLNAPTVTVIAPGSQTQTLTPQVGSHPSEWFFQFKPDQPGKWRLRVQDGGGAEIETLLRVASTSHAMELSGLPADTEGMRKLAQATGGALLNDGVPVTWTGKAVADSLLIGEHVQPLWNTWPILLLALSFYAIELIWRRRANLL